MVRCIHITPELPPAVGGIADYTAILSRRLVEAADGAVKPVLVWAGWKQAAPPQVDFPCVDLGGRCSATALTKTVSRLASGATGRAVVLLEYSGYGYAKRGAPLWLLRGLQQACGDGSLPLVTMVHELYATGPPWTSAFWMSPVQRYVAARLARLSCAVVTNREGSAAWLRRCVPPDTPLKVQPVFSNVGEPESLPPFEARGPYAVVFGSQGMKKRLYKALDVSHGQWLRQAGVERVMDLGVPPDGVSYAGDIPIEKQGVQPISAISAYICQARVGLLHYPVDYLTKSGVWSSYAAHAVPTVVISASAASGALEEGRHFMRLTTKEAGQECPNLAALGCNARSWYQAEAASCRAARVFESLMATTSDREPLPK